MSTIAVAQLTSKSTGESQLVPILDIAEEATVNDTMPAAIGYQTSTWIFPCDNVEHPPGK
jgi:thioester reductase-like protein